MAKIKDDAVEKELQGAEAPAQAAPPKKSFLKVGLPVLLVQIVVAYFLASYVIVPMFIAKANAEPATEEKSDEAVPDDEKEETEDDSFGFIFLVEDIIVNPAESKGEQFVLVNIAFEVKEEDDIKRMEKREPLIRDMLIRIISSKPIDLLDGPDDKEALRLEIKENATPLLAEGHLKNVYFVNYIIQ
ncbi:MAG: hypothetical protein D6748_05305 [Calditrichaeota bacterium]|nr:MAG: hypothetical protein D6748_05305 [Calditrichota bacterium]